MAKRVMKNWSLYSLLAVFIFSGITFGTHAYLNYEPYEANVISATERLSQLSLGEKKERFDPDQRFTESDDWKTIYPNTKQMMLGNTIVQASVAKTWPERITGLSNTPYLPGDVVKLFVFDTAGFHSIWMKDMLYAIDIVWLNEAGVVVHIEEEVAPETFPDLFSPQSPAIYVVETVAGFVKKHNLAVGDETVLPNFK